jgi:hypothetical protein
MARCLAADPTPRLRRRFSSELDNEIEFTVSRGRRLNERSGYNSSTRAEAERRLHLQPF